jgi:hypothetical protein
VSIHGTDKIGENLLPRGAKEVPQIETMALLEDALEAFSGEDRDELSIYKLQLSSEVRSRLFRARDHNEIHRPAD